MRGLRLVAGALFLFLSSCVSYDFEPVDPYALTLENPTIEVIGRIPANVMLVIDKSGSMDLPMNAADPSCGSCGQSKSSLCNTATCPTRWSELQSAMNAVLPFNNGVSRFGLVTYPSDNVCGSPGSIRVPIPTVNDAAQLQANTNNVNAIIQSITSSGVSGTANTTGGGTPTARALQLLQIDPALNVIGEDGRTNLAVLLTDGLPNCNANNPNSWTTNPTACRCTLGADCSSYPKEGCLDDTGTIAAVQNLRARGIKVLVIGFGAEVTSGPAPDVLRAIAQAGGFDRHCAAASDCVSGDSCNGGVCSSGLFLPTNRAELIRVLDEAGRGVGVCTASLSASADPDLVEVRIDDRKLARSEWTLAGSTLTVTGGACDELTNATPDDPRSLTVFVLREVP